MIHTARKCVAAVAVALAFWLGGFAAVTHAQPLTEEGCSAAVTEPANAEPYFEEIPGLSILKWNPAKPLRIRNLRAEVKGILCWRSDARFSRNDYVVALAGLPFYIKTDLADAKRNRTVVLEATQQGFRIRLLSGPEFTSSELEDMQRLIKHYNAQRARHEAEQVGKSKRPAVTL